MAIQIPRRVAKYSAGGGVFSLVPGEEEVLLVFNREAKRFLWIPDELIGTPEYTGRIEERLGNGEGAIAWFMRPAGFSTPFGKGEDEDGNDPEVTVLREVAEETGAAQIEVYNRMSRIQYTEHPNRWSPYSNTVYFVNGMDFPFHPDAISDPLLEREQCGFYRLDGLPLKTAERNGLYQASLRRIIALLFQVNDHRNLILRAGGTMETDVTVLVRKMLTRVRYHHIFSRRMVGMLCQFQRAEIALDRFKQDEGVVIADLRLIRQIIRNLTMWIDRSLLGEALDLIRRRCDRTLFTAEKLEMFFHECLERRSNPVIRIGDREGVWQSSEEETDDATL